MIVREVTLVPANAHNSDSDERLDAGCDEGIEFGLRFLATCVR
jgi:hypothetical protein